MIGSAREIASRVAPFDALNIQVTYSPPSVPLPMTNIVYAPRITLEGSYHDEPVFMAAILTTKESKQFQQPRHDDACSM